MHPKEKRSKSSAYPLQFLCQDKESQAIEVKDSITKFDLVNEEECLADLYVLFPHPEARYLS